MVNKPIAESGVGVRTVVVYESMYGNSRQVAERVGGVLLDAGVVDVVPVAAATHELVGQADLLIVGGPTHVSSLSSRRSRLLARHGAVAAQEHPDDGVGEHDKPSKSRLAMDPHWQGPGLRTWFRDLPEATGQFAAAFDTRLDPRAVLGGRASKAIARKLQGHGYVLVASPESFLVDSETRLLESEALRAECWARGLSTALLAAPPQH